VPAPADGLEEVEATDAGQQTVEALPYGLADIERRRMENIRRNNDELARKGLGPLAGNPAKRPAKPRKPRAQSQRAAARAQPPRKRKPDHELAPDLLPSDDGSDDDIHEAVCITGHKYRGKARQYEIEWEGDHPRSWEPAKHVSDDLVNAYLELHPEALDQPVVKPARDLTAPPPPPETEPAPEPAVTASVQQSTELRKYPRDLSAFTGYFVNNSECVELLASEGCFSLIKSGRHRGYIKSEYLSRI